MVEEEAMANQVVDMETAKVAMAITDMINLVLVKVATVMEEHLEVDAKEVTLMTAQSLLEIWALMFKRETLVMYLPKRDLTPLELECFKDQMESSRELPLSSLTTRKKLRRLAN